VHDQMAHNGPVSTTEVIPGPRSWPLLGNLPEYSRDPLGFLTGLRTRGDCVSWSLGPRRNVLVSSPELVTAAFSRMEVDFRRPALGWGFHLMFGDGVTASTGPPWQRKRAVVQPTLHARKVRWFGPEIVACAEWLASRWSERPHGQQIDIRREMTFLTRRITARTIFGAETAGREEAIDDAMAVVQAEIGAEFRGITAAFPPWVSTPGRKRLRAAVATLDEEIHRLLSEHQVGGAERGDVLSQLLAVRDEHARPLTAKELRDESIALYTGGHESVSAMLTWAWYLLSSAPAARRRLDTELANVLDGRRPTAVDLTKLTWTRQVLKETLRLYPVVWAAITTTSTDTMLAGRPLRAGTNIWISPWVTHRDPQWFSEPSSFRPERWDRDAAPNYQAWYPFGYGLRICLGAQFALTVTTTVIAVLAQRFQLKVRSAEVTAAPSLTLQPTAPIFAELHPARETTCARSRASGDN
jgi:cytochrome P450